MREPPANQHVQALISEMEKGALDAFRRDMPLIPTESKAIRAVLVEGLKALGYLETQPIVMSTLQPTNKTKAVISA